MSIIYENKSSYIGTFNYLRGEGIIIGNQIEVNFYLVDYGSGEKKELSEISLRSYSLYRYIENMNLKFSDYAKENKLSIKLK
jgi:hypothetical protein